MAGHWSLDPSVTRGAGRDADVFLVVDVNDSGRGTYVTGIHVNDRLCLAALPYDDLLYGTLVDYVLVTLCTAMLAEPGISLDQVC